MYTYIDISTGGVFFETGYETLFEWPWFDDHPILQIDTGMCEESG